MRRYMSTVTVRVSRKVHNELKDMAKNSNETIQNVIEKALLHYKEAIFWRNVNKAYSTLKENESMWNEEKDERNLWDGTLMDNQNE